MTRVVVQRGSASSSSSSSSASASSSSSSGQNRALTPTSIPASPASLPSPLQHVAGVPPVVQVNDGYLVEDQEQIVVEELSEYSDVSDDKMKGKKNEDISPENLECEEEGCKNEKSAVSAKFHDNDDVGSLRDFGGSSVVQKENDAVFGKPFEMATGSSCPPPPPLPPPKPFSMASSPRRLSPTGSNAVRIGPSRLSSGWPVVLNRSSPTGSRPSSPRSHSEAEGYNSADEQNPCFTSTYDDAVREHQFEAELRRVKGFEVRKMMEDGNCLFRAVADQVYGDSGLYDLVRQMCIDYMERERDHFSQFVTEGFTSYCKRKRRDKVYGNNVEIQALSEMYNRPIHIYSYSTEPINIFHGSYNTDTPPIRLSYHHGNHYNSLVDPRRLNIGAGLGFNSLQGTNVDRDQVKAAIKAQQDQQIENALVAEGRFYSDLELTEKEIERMVLEDSRKEYLAGANKFNHHQQLHVRDSSSSQAEPSSSAARSSSECGESVASNISMQMMLSMGFSYLQVVEAYNIFGDDVDSMVSYLIETSNRRKGKATE